MRERLRLAAIVVAFVVVAALGARARAADSAAGGDILSVPIITIYPGDIISDEMLADQSFPAGTNASSAILAQRQAIVGRVARRTLLPGKPIAANAIAEPDIVRRGTIIHAYFDEGGLSITTLVLSLQSGAVGAIIQCRNVDSGRVIMGTVQADGSIRIGAAE
jgi:flagella basal body P-ring formation protein FlgA